MGLRTVVFLLSVAVAASVDPKPCCYPDQFVISSSTLVSATGGRKGTYTLNLDSQLAFDVTNNRWGVLYTEYKAGKTSQHQTIVNYDTQEKYVIDLDQRKCDVYENLDEMKHCVNPKATFEQSEFLGDRELTVDTFGYDLKEGELEGYLSQSVTQGDCLPSSERYQGKQGQGKMVSISDFYNYVAGIENPSKFFDVPDYCPQSYSKRLVMDEFVLGNIIF